MSAASREREIETWGDFDPEPDDFADQRQYEEWLSKQPPSIQRRVLFEMKSRPDDMHDTIKQEEQNCE